MTHYVDDSGSEATQFSLMGGPIFAQKNFSAFHHEWGRLVNEVHGVEPPIHMRDFSQTDGRLACLADEKRRWLLNDLVELINRFKAYSLTVVVDNLDFSECFPLDKFRGYMGAHPLAFLWCMILNHGIMSDKCADCTVSYVYASSRTMNSQISDSHDFWTSYENAIEARHTGSLMRETPQSVSSLQAADLVAWANFRKHRGLPFNEGYEPLERLTRFVESDTKPAIHFHFPKLPSDES